MAIRKMCDELGLRFRRCSEDTKAMLKEQANGNPTTAQMKTEHGNITIAIDIM